MKAKRFLALALVLCMLAPLGAFAAQETIPMWQAQGYTSQEAYMDDYSMLLQCEYDWAEQEWHFSETFAATWKAEHAEECAAFRAGGWLDYLEREYSWYLDSIEDGQTLYEYWGISQDELSELMYTYWLDEQINAAAAAQSLENFRAESPALYAEFESNALSYFSGYYTWITVEEYLAENSMTEEELILDMVSMQISSHERKAKDAIYIAEYYEAFPGTEQELDAVDLKPWIERHYYDFDEFCHDFLLETEEEIQICLRARYLISSAWDLLDLRRSWAEINAFAAENPAEFAAMEQAVEDGSFFAEAFYWYYEEAEYMDDYDITWEELKVELLEHQIFIFLSKQAAAAELSAARLALGGVPGEIGIVFEGEFLPLAAGAVTLAENTTYTSAATLATYFGGDATGDGAVAIRPWLETRGYSVYWDSAYEAVVVLHREQMAEELNSRYNLINQMLASMALPEEDFSKGAIAMDVNLTLLDSLNGDIDLAVDYGATFTKEGNLITCDGVLKLEDVLSLLATSFDMASGYIPSEYLAMLELKELPIHFTYDLETQELTISPIEALGITDEPMSMNLHDLLGVAPATGNVPTVADFAFMDADARISSDNSSSIMDSDMDLGYGSYRNTPVDYYSLYTSADEEIISLLADDCFVTEGDNQVLHLSAEDLGGYITHESSGVTLVIGEDTGSISLVMNTHDYSALKLIRESVTLEITYSPGEQSLTLTMHLKNQMKLELTANVTFA